MKCLFLFNPIYTLSSVVTRYFIGRLASAVVNFILRRVFRMQDQIMESLRVTQTLAETAVRAVAALIRKREKCILAKAAKILTNSDIHEMYFATLVSSEDINRIAEFKKAGGAR